jgi:hypothetical protein
MVMRERERERENLSERQLTIVEINNFSVRCTQHR